MLALLYEMLTCIGYGAAGSVQTYIGPKGINPFDKEEYFHTYGKSPATTFEDFVMNGPAQVSSSQGSNEALDKRVEPLRSTGSRVDLACYHRFVYKQDLGCTFGCIPCTSRKVWERPSGLRDSARQGNWAQNRRGRNTIDRNCSAQNRLSYSHPRRRQMLRLPAKTCKGSEVGKGRDGARITAGSTGCRLSARASHQTRFTARA